MTRKHRHLRRRLVAAAVAVTVPAVMVTTSQAATGAPPTGRSTTATGVVVNGSTRYQTIDGFGVSQAFGTANQIRYLGDTPARRAALDALFDTETGAGFSILRNLIPSDPGHTMVPVAPDSPADAPAYVWDPTAETTDWGQLWLAREATSYGVTTFYNDAWSAPGYMKTNGTENNGGMLCGTPGAECDSGDWRQAYADYLVQHAENWASVGLEPTVLGFTNEPTYTPGYSSMEVTPEQAVDIAAVLGDTLADSDLDTVIACCDTVGWDDLPDYTSAVLADADATEAVGLFTSHGYSSAPTYAVDAGGKKVWVSEWANGSGTFNTAWDDGSTTSGFAWAQNIFDSLTDAEANAFLYWYGISTSTGSNAALVQLSGTTLVPTKRYDAMVNYSRFIRPGAVRLGTTSVDGALQVASFRNTDGSVVVVALNTATSASSTTFRVRGVGSLAGTVTPYLTNAANSTAAQPTLTVRRGAFAAAVPARSLVTFVIPSS